MKQGKKQKLNEINREAVEEFGLTASESGEG